MHHASRTTYKQYSQRIVIEWQDAAHTQLEDFARWVRGCPASQQVHVYVGREENPHVRKTVIRTFQSLGCTVTSRLSIAPTLV